MRVFGIDQSTNITGWSFFDEEKLVKFGTYHTTEKKSCEKIAQTKGWLASMIRTWKPELVVLEDIQLQTSNGIELVTTYKTLAHLQGVLENFCLETGQKYLICHPSKWRELSGIKGKTRKDKKKQAQNLIKELYNSDVTEDEADAILIGKWGVEQEKNNKIITF